MNNNSIFIILHKFSENKEKAGSYMKDHNEWIKRGFDDNIFLLVGGLQPSLGGGILAYNISFSALQDKVNEDPFVKEKVVRSEIFEVSPSKIKKEIQFLFNK